jgi:hypothetical protein
MFGLNELLGERLLTSVMPISFGQPGQESMHFVCGSMCGCPSYVLLKPGRLKHVWRIPPRR